MWKYHDSGIWGAMAGVGIGGLTKSHYKGLKRWRHHEIEGFFATTVGRLPRTTIGEIENPPR
jgi:hypothetical protein